VIERSREDWAKVLLSVPQLLSNGEERAKQAPAGGPAGSYKP